VCGSILSGLRLQRRLVVLERHALAAIALHVTAQRRHPTTPFPIAYCR
jgi:hypothetical protein